MINRYVEFRHDTASGIVTGTVMKYGDVAHVGRTYHERFMPGSIEYDDVVLNLLHDRQQPVARLGAGLDLQETSKSLEARIEIPQTTFGRRARELINAKIIRGLSAEFIPKVESFEGGMRVIKRAELHGIGLVDRPAYPASTLDMRSAIFSGELQIRQGLISGFIPFLVEGLVSMQNRRKMLIERGALELAEDGVYLLSGYDYNASLAATAANSLFIDLLGDGIRFFTRRMAPTQELREVRRRIRGGLINGVVPGIAVTESEVVESGGFTIERVKKGILCEINLTARQGLKSDSGFGRRRVRWLF